MTKSILLISLLVLAWIMPAQAGTPQVAPGLHHTCAITTEGQLLCWGGDEDGQLGDGTLGAPDQRIVPQPVTGLPGPASAIQMGIRHGCAIIAADQSLWCWGQDFQGELGDGTVGQPERQPYAGRSSASRSAAICSPMDSRGRDACRSRMRRIFRAAPSRPESRSS